MLKVTLITTIAFFFLFGCNTTGEDATKTFRFTSGNILTDSANYFSFTENTADTTGESNWDLKFLFFVDSVQIGPPGYIKFDNPFFKGASSLGIARVDAVSLDEVKEVPRTYSNSTYSTKESEDNWYIMTEEHKVKPLDYVYVLNTTDGKHPAFEITDYYDDQGESGVFTIAWKYLSE